MNCASCGSGNQSEFTAEVNVHFRGLPNLDNPGVLASPKIFDLLGLRPFAVYHADNRIGAACKRYPYNGSLTPVG